MYIVILVKFNNLHDMLILHYNYYLILNKCPLQGF